jgi:hypothetical protein
LDVYRLRTEFIERAKGTTKVSSLRNITKHAAHIAAKAYSHEFGGGALAWGEIFSDSDINQTAKYLYDAWLNEADYKPNPKARKKNPVGAVRSKREPIKIFEIYTKHPETGETGWNIEWVRSTEREIKSYPDFDVIITRNDFPMQGDRSIIVDWHLKKNPKGRKKMVRKKRTAKQLANDKRLGRMAKAKRRANPKRARGKLLDSFSAISPSNPKRTALKKSHLWIVFGCDTKDFTVYYLTVGGINSPQVQVTDTKSDSVLFATKSQASYMANITQKIWPSGLVFGVTSANTSKAEIKAYCKKGKA